MALKRPAPLNKEKGSRRGGHENEDGFSFERISGVTERQFTWQNDIYHRFGAMETLESICNFQLPISD